MEDSYHNHPVLLHKVEHRVREAAKQGPPKIIDDELTLERPTGDPGERCSEFVEELVAKSFDLLVVPVSRRRRVFLSSGG